MRGPLADDPEGAAALGRQAWLDRVQCIHAYLLRDLTIRLGRQDAEDVLQEFYLRVLRYRPQLDGEASVRSFIYRILRSVVTDHFRRLAVQAKVAASIERHWESPAVEPSGENTAYDHLRSLIGELPYQYATLIERVDINDEPRSEVAANLGITTNNLAVRLLRARSALRSRASAKLRRSRPLREVAARA